MRNLPIILQDLQESRLHRPAYIVRVFDIVSTRSLSEPDSIGTLIIGDGQPINEIAGPLDITDKITSIAFSERASDFIGGSIQGNSLDISFEDRLGIFDPVESGSESRWLRSGNIIQVIEGSDQISQDLWITTFTGALCGSPGSSSIDRSGNRILTLFAEDRLSEFSKSIITSEPFPQGVSLAFMMRSILENELGMSESEFNLGLSGQSILTSQVTTQIVDEPAMVAIAKLAFPDGFVPKFRGDGVLELVQNFASKPSSIAYENDELFESFSRPLNRQETPNRVEVLGLASELTKITQPNQVLATAGITQGFFAGDSSIRIQFSDDGTQQAENTSLRRLSSIRGGLVPFGDNEEWEPDVNPDGTVNGGRIQVDGAFYAPLIVSLHVSRLAASAIPDSFAGFGGGSTIPIGRLIEGVAAIQIALINATIGRGQYEVLGDPLEFVFEELRGVVEKTGISARERRTVVIENHLLDSQSLVDDVAMREYLTVRKRGNTRSLTMRHDLRLEPIDKFIDDRGRSFIITSIGRTITRDGASLAVLEMYETTDGVFP